MLRDIMQVAKRLPSPSPAATAMTTLRLLAVLCALSLTTVAYAAEKATPPPNVVLIVSDDQGFADLSCIGDNGVRTPNLDKLAADGTRLTSFYVSWPACTPSRGSIMTGRYPQRNGTYDMIRNEAPDFDYLYKPEEYAVTAERILGTDVREIFLADVLKKQGYTSAVFGKWDGGQLKRFLPLQRGFDEYYGFANTGVDYFTHERYGVPSMFRNNQPTEEDKGTYLTDLFEREAIRFVDENKNRPFFLYLPFNAPHSASNLDRSIRGLAQAPQEYLDHYPSDDSKAQKRRQHYLAAVECMDDAIGKVMQRLEEHQITDNTLVIFLSDNGGGGGSDNSPLRGGKAKMFEGGNRVPCIVRWKGKVPAGKVSDEFLTSLEIFPTVVAATGGKLPADVIYDGFDMLPTLNGGSSPRQEMFWKRQGDIAARVGDWKWVDSAAGKGLFNLATDIGEKNDLSKEHPEMLAKLKERFANWTAEMEAAEPRGPFRDY
ncbi:sulfatase-like hydrolase/transferase [Blastopirellula sp. JC732]|uniref:Sulfatase-like hydrolase/transferase n=1 Tax=Blastopirellula sediminis TaxID=2894196 RepID=A0A9X1MLB3_9BACT|nr:sulfatase-like hydrolase/transferase [Blastopirellula sediminis]MCC9607434.1 sulfatase-like hydrolase/transferase [Blastopirellula sediminis]MCC9629273.1 sulfatase-like hydrolase/transferase [Blastopirellula sediminis]